MSSEELRNYATVVAAIVALLVFIVVPRSTQIYMLGSYSPTILKLMTDAERSSMYWELARRYLEGIAIDAERYKNLTPAERAQFWR